MGDRFSTLRKGGREFLLFRLGDSLDLSSFGVGSPETWTVSAERVLPCGDMEYLGTAVRVPTVSGVKDGLLAWRESQGLGHLSWVLVEDNTGSELDGEGC
jgi:hypothetical protein